KELIKQGCTGAIFTTFPYRAAHTSEAMTQKVLSTMILAACSILHVAHAQSTFGDLRGTTRDPSGLALAHATVTVHSLDANTDRSVVSGDDGSFVVENLLPGHYQLTAAKADFQSASATKIELSARQSLRVDLTLALASQNQ